MTSIERKEILKMRIIGFDLKYFYFRSIATDPRKLQNVNNVESIIRLKYETQ